MGADFCMSQLILDEQLDVQLLLPRIRRFAGVKPVQDVKPGELVPDERRRQMFGHEPPMGSRLVTSGEFPEYRLDIFLGSDREMYARVHPKILGPYGKLVLRKFCGRSYQLST